MSAISNILPNPPANFSTTLSGSISDSDLTIGLNSVSGLGAEGVGVIYAKGADGTPTASSIEFVHWTSVGESSIVLTDTDDRGITGSASGAQAHNAGDTFEVWVHPSYYPGEGLLVEHSTAGLHTVDHIAEKTSAHGVIVDGVTLKDGLVTTTGRAKTLFLNPGETDSNLGTVSAGYALALADATDLWATANFYVPFDYVDGTTITCKVLWHSSAASGNMYWSGYAYFRAVGESKTNDSVSLTNQTTATGGADKTNATTIWSATTMDVGDVVGIQFRRLGSDANDTLGVGVYVTGFIIEYTGNS